MYIVEYNNDNISIRRQHPLGLPNSDLQKVSRIADVGIRGLDDAPWNIPVPEPEQAAR